MKLNNYKHDLKLKKVELISKFFDAVFYSLKGVHQVLGILRALILSPNELVFIAEKICIDAVEHSMCY